ncbi:MAG: glycosyltransferase family 4 protein [Verrucomicrobiota bacterium]|nr:glycosyltransferase family 4 protein [Verrucomicrobiota bacterium]
MHDPTKPLRILVVVNLPWDSRLGASRVWIELAEQWRARGHTVEKFSMSEAFPGGPPSRVMFAIRQVTFIRKAAAFVRKNGNRFDVIDALVGTLPYSRAQLGFAGVIIARSVGLYRLYDKFDATIQQRWPRPREGKLSGRILYGFTRSRLLRASENSVRRADLLNVPNEEEAACLRDEIGVRQPIVVQPYGFAEEKRRALVQAAESPAVRIAQQRVCFIGMWGPRKGSYDWGAIIDRVRAEVPEVKFRFLGTMVTEETVRKDLGGSSSAAVEFVSDFQPDELPRWLADCTVGAFPSYVEGFGLAVMEQLGAGLPTVAYDTAGPRDMLGAMLPELLAPPGDIEKFSVALIHVLRLDAPRYAEISARSRAAVAGLSWSRIADETLQAYREALARLT